ncbi:MAG TPA: sulfotransferase domain-containing protein [Pirellulales bacterium]|nr:sulfotransferase domain-containing protein [Pirellulales bacterium]
MLPNFIGIGAPKAGTTWLARCLGEHPQIFMAAVKETSFFRYADPDGRIKEYEEHFAGAEGAVAVGEFTTSYLESDRPPVAINRLLPQVRLLVSLRNPIDQVYSHYWHLARQNFHLWAARDVPRSFEEAVECQPDRLFAVTQYHHHLRRWLNYFERRQLLILFYDDLRCHPQQVLCQVYDFLGVDPSFVAPSTQESGATVRRGVSPRSSGSGRMHAILYDRLNRCVYRPLKNLLGVRRAARLKDLFHIRQVMETVFFQPGYPPMHPDTRAMLAKRFADEIGALEELTGKDLSHWK